MIDPVLLNLGPLQIRYYGILFALAFLIGYLILRKLSKKFDIKEQVIEDFMPWIMIAAVVGARLFKVLVYEPEYYFANPLKIFAVWEGGLASHGAIILITLTTIWFCKKRKINLFKFADLLVIPIALGACFIRIGNFTNSEIVGKITDLPWAVKFIGYEGLRHPVQLYQALGYIIIFIGLLFLLKIKNRENGTMLWSFLILDSIFRFITEFFKDVSQTPIYYFGLDLPQWLSIIIFIIAFIALFKQRLHKP